MKLYNPAKDVSLSFEVEEIEYDRAEGASIALQIQSFNIQAKFYSIWWERITLANFIADWENKAETPQIKQSDFHLKFACSSYEDKKLSVGLQITQDFHKKLKEFPISVSLSFELADECLPDFILKIKQLERNCRAWGN